MTDYYKILGVTRDATAEEIKSAFRIKAKKLHPDVNKAPDAHKSFIEIAEAYEILNNPVSRREYDSLFCAQNSKMEHKQSSYRDFQNRQEKANQKAQYYADISLDEILSSIAKFTYELGRAAIVGERDKPKITLWDYIKLGFYGILLTICIIMSLTGVGAIPGVVIGMGVVKGMNKNGKMIGIMPLLMSTIVADTLVVFVVYSMLASMF